MNNTNNIKQKAPLLRCLAPPNAHARFWTSNSAKLRAAFGSAQPRIASQFYPVRGFAAQGGADVRVRQENHSAVLAGLEPSDILG